MTKEKAITKKEWEQFQKIGSKFANLQSAMFKKIEEFYEDDCLGGNILDYVNNPHLNNFEKLEQELKKYTLN